MLFESRARELVAWPSTFRPATHPHYGGAMIGLRALWLSILLSAVTAAATGAARRRRREIRAPGRVGEGVGEGQENWRGFEGFCVDCAEGPEQRFPLADPHLSDPSPPLG